MMDIDRQDFRINVERILLGSISQDYIGDILDSPVSPKGETFYDKICEDVFYASAWIDEGYYNEDDIRLAIGRAILDILQERNQ